MGNKQGQILGIRDRRDCGPDHQAALLGENVLQGKTKLHQMNDARWPGRANVAVGTFFSSFFGVLSFRLADTTSRRRT